MKSIILIALFVSISISQALCDVAPTVKIPYAKNQINLDGKIAPQEWSDAAIIRNIQVMGNSRPAYPATEIFIKHDGKSLWIAAKCYEKEHGYPKSLKRQTTDLLSNDDSIQIVLGTTDRDIVSRDVINYGGYAGATNQSISAADFYYQFTVNSIGSKSRFFIESPLDRPLFDSKVSTQKGFWTVEMRIPFASWGVADPTGMSFPANFFRFRPPDMTAWHLPAFGNYAPMPLGIAEFLSKERYSERTLEPKINISPSHENAKAIMVDGNAQFAENIKGVTGFLEWYPAVRKVIAVVSAGKDSFGATAILSVPGVGDKKLILNTLGQRQITVSVPELFTATVTGLLTVTDRSGKTLLSNNVEVKPEPKPLFASTTVGEKYSKGAVPPPWTAPIVNGKSVKLYDKKLTFGSSGLFSSVASNEMELLAGEGRIELEYSGKSIKTHNSKFTCEVSNSRVIVKSSASIGKGMIETRSTVEFDGLTILKVRLKGLDRRKINKLSVVFPIKPEYARFIQFWSIQQAQELRGVGYEGPAGPIWVGNQEKGLSVNFDTPVFLSTNRRSQIQIVEKPRQTLLKLNLVDGYGQIPEDNFIFRLMLQPTPTKKTSIAKTGLYGGKISLWFEDWSDYQGYPDLAKLPEVTKRANAAHEQNQLFILYFCQLLAKNAPGFEQYKTDFKIRPDAQWYTRAYDIPGKGVPCYVCCLHGPYKDLLLSGIDELMKKGGIDGIYMDGTMVPWDCNNPSHNGCGNNYVVKWDSEDNTRITEVRDFAKRLRGMFADRGKPFVLVAHCGGAMDMPVLSLVDSYYEGEQLARYRPAYALPLHKFAVGYSGWNWGLRTDMIPALWSSQAAKLLPWSLLHDTQVSNSAADTEKKIYGDFSDPSTTTYYPYWKKQPHIKKTSGKALFSYYRKNDDTMLIVSNLTWNKQKVGLDVSRVYNNKLISMVDAVSGASIAFSSGKITIEMDPHTYKAIRISTKLIPASAVTPVMKIAPKLPAYAYRSFDKSQWSVNIGEAGVSMEYPFVLDQSSTGMKINSVIYNAASRSTFIPGISPEGTIKLKIRRSNRLEINIGGGIIIPDPWWQPTITPDNDGKLFQVKWDQEKTDVVTLSYSNGKLDAVYGDQPWARGLKLTNLGSDNTLKISTWSGDWVAFEVLEISDKPTRLFSEKAAHPVL